MTAPPLLPLRALDLPRLVRHLSSPRALPASYHMRNRLVHAFLHADGFPPAPGRYALPQARPWNQVLRDGNVGWAVGNVPSRMLVDRREEGRIDLIKPNQDGDGEEAPWAVVLLAPGFAQGNAKPTARVDLWLNVSIAEGEPSASLFKHILERVVPDLVLEHFPQSQAEPGERRRARFLCCSFAESEAAGVRQLQAARAARDGPDAFRIRFDNRCLRFVGSCTRLQRAQLALPPDAGWRLDHIKEDDIPDVVATNKIPYPPSYVREHMHISSTIRRRRPGTADEWEPVGWTYAHTNLFVASLYVRPEHRTAKIPLAQPPHTSEEQAGIRTQIGLGTLVTLDLTDQLVRAQAAALRALGLDDLLSESDTVGGKEPETDRTFGPTEVVGESEVDNVTAHAFVRRGPRFREAGGTSWMLVEIEPLLDAV